MFFRKNKKRESQRSKQRLDGRRNLCFEQLERRDLLTIIWDNPGPTNDQDHFNLHYDANADIARAIVRRAVDDWNKVITDFNFAEDDDSDLNNDLNNEFHLTVLAEELTNDRRDEIQFADMQYNGFGVPKATTIRLDDDGGGAPGPGWFFDATPTDDIEFTGIGTG